MKKSFLLCFLLCVYITSSAQCDYTKSKYLISEEKDVIYGTAISFEGSVDTLKMNIYKPINNDPNRPVLMMIHGGGFSTGRKESFDATCKNMAKKGFVTATISYRLGFYRPIIPNSYPYPYDEHEFRRAVYRAIQDGFGAVRFLKGRSAQDSSDNKNFYIGGGSAGAITAMQLAFAHHDSLKISSSGALGKVVLGLNQFSRPDLGSIFGNLNKNGTSNKVQGVVNIYGAISDTSWILNGNGPVVWSYHQTGDPVVPCGKNKPYHGLGLGISDKYDVIYGSCFLLDFFKRKGYDSMNNIAYIHNGVEHAIHNKALVEEEYTNFLNYHICFNRSTSMEERLVNKAYRIYPNPFNSEFVLEAEKKGKIVLRNVQGKLVLETRFAYGKNRVDVARLNPGLYFLTLYREGNIIKQMKVLKQ